MNADHVRGEGRGRAHRTMNAGYYPSALLVKTRESGPSGARELRVKVRSAFYEKSNRYVCELSTHLFGLAVRVGRKVCVRGTWQRGEWSTAHSALISVRQLQVTRGGAIRVRTTQTPILVTC